MTHRQPRATTIARHGLLALALALSVLTGPAGVPRLAFAAQKQDLWYQAYDQGVKATRAGDWALAISALEVARRGGPAPGRRVAFQGDRVDVFNPDYYLGLAYNATRRYAEAEAAFARVVSAGLVRQGDREFEELRKQTARATYERTLQDGDRAVAAGRFADAEKALQSIIGTLADDGRAGKLVERAREALNAGNVAPAGAAGLHDAGTDSPPCSRRCSRPCRRRCRPRTRRIANVVQQPLGRPADGQHGHAGREGARSEERCQHRQGAEPSGHRARRSAAGRAGDIDDATAERRGHGRVSSPATTTPPSACSSRRSTSSRRRTA